MKTGRMNREWQNASGFFDPSFGAMVFLIHVLFYHARQHPLTE